MKEIVITKKSGITLNTKKTLVDDDIKIKIDKSILKEESKGKIEITTTDEVDVSGYDTAQIVDSDLIPENIAKDVNILGVKGTFEGGSSEDTLSAIENNTLINYSNNNLTRIKQGIFQNCTSLESVDLPNVTALESNAFNSCTNLKSVNLPNCTTTSTMVFSGCTSLVNVNMPLIDSVQPQMFIKCSFQSVRFTQAISIGLMAFRWCDKLTDLYLGYDGLVSLANTNAFSSSSTDIVLKVNVHVRSEYADQYATATNWSSLIAAGTIVIVGDYSD